MSAPWTCDRLQESAAELALGLADGPERADALAHLERCDSCRVLVGDLTRVVDHLLLVGPVEEPPPGFEGRVLERLADHAVASGGAVPVALAERRHRRVARRQGARSGSGRMAKLLVAAAVVVAVAVGGLVLTGRRSSTTADAAVREAPMVTPAGQTVGKVDLGGSPRTVFVTLPGWYAPHGPKRHYRLRLTLADGSHRDFASVGLWEDGVWGAATTVDAARVRSVSLLDSAGHVLCHARLAST